MAEEVKPADGKPVDGTPGTPPVEDKQPPKEDPGKTAAPPSDGANPPTETPPAKSDDGKPTTPTEYKLKVPDGSLLDPSRVEKIVSYAKERGFSEKQAQELLEREHEVLADFNKSQMEAMNKEANGWVDTIKTDKELGGDAFKENVALANRLVKRFGSEQFVKILNDTGLGNHPELVRFCVRVGKLMSEDKLVLPGAQPGPAKKSTADVLYGGTTQPN